MDEDGDVDVHFTQVILKMWSEIRIGAHVPGCFPYMVGCTDVLGMCEQT